MNQQLIFNNDFQISPLHDAIVFSCLISGMKVCCYIKRPTEITADAFLQQVKKEAFNWEDKTEQAIADDTFNELGEIWL